ncbi:hypothetical protein [Flexivirga oryzae]|uniref:DUF4232 domain-containing protein n=1 Tax=Flexivirga oryzae TaxID=1794944 RepID=A0A839N390_9MICO|nr:hypothetical protein [Flexivirga oryzae]MBB2891777.1 hypothetical protein [Flexivirga oryzae]
MGILRSRLAIAGIAGALAASGAIATAGNSSATGSAAPSSTSGSTGGSATSSGSPSGEAEPHAWATPGACTDVLGSAYRSTVFHIQNTTSENAQMSVTFGSYGRKGETSREGFTLAPGASKTVPMTLPDTSAQIQLQVTWYDASAGDSDPYIPIFWLMPGSSPAPTSATRLCAAGANPTSEPPTPSPVTTEVGVTG